MVKVVGERLRVARSAGDVAGAACAQQVAAEQVHPRRVGDDAAVVTHSALVVEHRHVEPRKVGAEAGHPQDRANVAPAKIDLEGGGRTDRRRLEPMWRLDQSGVSAALPLVEPIKQAIQLQIGKYADVIANTEFLDLRDPWVY